MREEADEPTVTVVIVSYCSRETLPFALDPLAEAVSRGRLVCTVVDNASSDDTVGFVRSEYPWVDVVESGGNIGFGRGCNIGIERSRTPYILLLNPDARLPAADIAYLAAFMDSHPDAGIVGPATREPDGRLGHAARLPSPGSVLGAQIGRGIAPRKVMPGDEPFETNWMSGCVLMLRREMIDEVGGLDPRFFLYFEETDLCKRIEPTRWQVWATGKALGEHLSAVAATNQGLPMYDGCIAEHYFRSRFYYLIKHFGWPRAALAEILEIVLLFMTQLPRIALGRDGSRLWVRLRAPMLKCPKPIADGSER